jgi:hypothetical protein
MALLLQLEDRGEFLLRGAGGLGLADGVEHVGHGVGGAVEQRLGAVLDRRPVAQLLFGHVVAGLAGIVDVEQGAADPVAADLHRPLALVGHVAVGAAHAAAGVDALAPELELGVLGLVDGAPVSP